MTRKDGNGIRRLYVDENTAPIVKEIFESYLKGLSTLEISKLLHERKFYVATDYRKYGKVIADSDEPVRIWNPTTVLQVLKNRVYTGTLIQGRNQKHLYEVRKRERLSEEHWTGTENAHEAIISIDTFEKVQMMISSKSSPIKNSRQKMLSLKRIRYFEEKFIVVFAREECAYTGNKVVKNLYFILAVIYLKNLQQKNADYLLQKLLLGKLLRELLM